MTPIELGALLDGWAGDGRVRLVETPAALTISRLDIASVQQVAAASHELGWSFQVSDAAGEAVDLPGLEDELGPFVGTLEKPAEGADRRVLTAMGFAKALAEPTEGVWQVACVKTAFVTGSASFSPWGQADLFAPSSETKSPWDLVREANEVRMVPADVRKWLLRGAVSKDLWEDRGFQVFVTASIQPLFCSLATEIHGGSSIVFSGPPRLSMVMPAGDVASLLDRSGYQQLQGAVAWVYEDPATAEQRHALFAAEVARSVARTETLAAAIRSAGRDILEGARLAFQLSQSDLSREAIKAQGDLRRAIADDTSKAAEGARTLAGATAVAIATGIALVAARSTTATEPWVLSLVAGVVAIYLVVVALSGWAHLGLQTRLRSQWRTRFYRFVSADDYKAMVTDPAKSAELPYHMTGIVSLIVSAALGWLAVTEWTRASTPEPTETRVEGAAKAPDPATDQAQDKRPSIPETPVPLGR